MKRNRLTKLAALAVITSMLFTAAACGSGEKPGTDDKSNTSAGTGSSNTNTKIDPLAKYDPPVTITAWRSLSPTLKYENGDTIDNNAYTKAYLDQLGIKLNYVWTVPEEQFEQKMNISIASGDLPDILWLYNKQLIDLAENDMLYDLTKLYETNTSATTKEIMQQDQVSFDTAKVGGKLMALPYTGSAIDSLHMMYLRTDWLQNLGLSEPKTMQDVLNIASAFAKKDPDKNGKDDTYGLALVKTFLTEGHANANGFFAGYHAYPRRWVKDASGKLTYGSIAPETKVALKQLQDMYKDGLIDKEFGVKDRAKVAETVSAGKVGIEFGSMSGPLSFLQTSVDNDPKAEWKSFPLPSIDNNPAAAIAKMPITKYFAVSKKSKNPEAIMKLLEFGTKGYTKDADPSLGTSPSGIPVWQYAVVGYEPARKNLDAHLHIADAIKTKDASKLNVEEKGYYDKIVDFRAGNRKNWGTDRVFGSPSSFEVINSYVQNKSYIYDGFYGAPTPTMVEKRATLEKMEDEVFTKIIMGQSIDTFDKFIDDWRKLGGDQITKEVNDWAARNK